jgi:hypothetical protein
VLESNWPWFVRYSVRDRNRYSVKDRYLIVSQKKDRYLIRDRDEFELERELADIESNISRKATLSNTKFSCILCSVENSELTIVIIAG